jgi:hypothetical protein
MPRKSIKVVSLDPVEQNEQADERTTLIHEIDATEQPAEPVVGDDVVIDDVKTDVEPVAVEKTRAKRTTSKEPSEKPVVVKAPRPKRASKVIPSEPVQAEPIESNQPAPGLSLNSEPVPPVDSAEPNEPVKMKKQIEKVAYDKCGKMMSAKPV